MKVHSFATDTIITEAVGGRLAERAPLWGMLLSGTCIGYNLLSQPPLPPLRRIQKVGAESSKSIARDGITRSRAPTLGSFGTAASRCSDHSAEKRAFLLPSRESSRPTNRAPVVRRELFNHPVSREKTLGGERLKQSVQGLQWYLAPVLRHNFHALERLKFLHR